MDFYGQVVIDGGGQANETVTAKNVVTGVSIQGTTDSNGYLEMKLPWGRYRISMTTAVLRM